MVVSILWRFLVHILAVDISNVFWSLALIGSLADTNAPRDMALREIATFTEGYDRVVIAIDGDEREPEWPQASWRVSIYPEYKADRKKRPAHRWSLLLDTIKHCESKGWTVLRGIPLLDPNEDGRTMGYVEADDVIGGLCAWARANGHSVDIISDDSDLAQLAMDKAPPVRWCPKNRKEKKRYLLDEKGVWEWVGANRHRDGKREWLGCAPKYIAAMKAIAGDGSDSYGTVYPGIGDATALLMLAASEWDPIKAITNTINSTKRNKDNTIPADVLTCQKLGTRPAEIALKLATLVTDAPIDYSVILLRPVQTTPPGLAQGLAPQEVEFEEVAGEAKQSTALTTTDSTARMLVSPAEMRLRLQEFQAAIKAVLVENVDYGKIPGCGDKPALFKSGAEKFAEVYGYAPVYEVMKSRERFGESPLFFYRIKCRLQRKSDNVHIAECIGSANSLEGKWGFRWVYERDVPAHLDTTRLKMRTFKSKKPRTPDEMVVQYQVPNEQIFDQANTILKMAQKRAFVGAVLIATRASGVFAADLDDMDNEHMGAVGQEPQWKQ